MRPKRLRVFDEEAPCPLANPLYKARIPGAPDQRLDAVQRVGRTAASLLCGLRPLIDQGERQSHLRGDLLRVPFLVHFTQQLVGLHAEKMRNPRVLGKLQATWVNLALTKSGKGDRPDPSSLPDSPRKQDSRT